MNVHTNAPAPLLFLVGLGFLAGACALAYFSSPATLTATRSSPSTVDVVIEDRVFGLWPVAREQYRGVRAARGVRPQSEGSSRSSTGRFLVFDTASGPTYAGPSHHLFLSGVDEIQGFIADPARGELTIHVLSRGEELRRFVFSQAAVAFLALVGGFLAWLGVRALFPDPYAGVGPH